MVFKKKAPVEEGMSEEMKAQLGFLKQLESHFNQEQLDKIMLILQSFIEEPKTVSYTHLDVYKRQGYYKLANPRLIHDDILLEFTVELGSMEGHDPKTQLYVGLHGTITTP